MVWKNRNRKYMVVYVTHIISGILKSAACNIRWFQRDISHIYPWNYLIQYRQIGHYYLKLPFMGNFEKVAEGHALPIQI